MQPDIQTFFDPVTATATFLVSDPASGEAAVIDPVLDYEPRKAGISTASADAILHAIQTRGLTLRYVLETHAHADHLSSADYLRRRTGATVAIGADITHTLEHFAPLFEADDVDLDGGAFDHLLADGETLPLGGLTVTAMHTPGHTAACTTFRVGDAAFVGDTLFMPDYGTARTDFPGGDAVALYHSIRRILDLPPETRIFVGHDYLPEGRTEFRWETTVARQRAENVHIHDGVTEAEFVAMRRARDATLAPPLLILPSLQVNIRAGALPPPTAEGHVYLRLPVTLN